MLSLVNYGSSEESEDEENGENKSSASSEAPKIPDRSSINDAENNSNEEWQEENNVKINPNSNNGKRDDQNVEADDDNLLSKLPPPVSDLRSIPWDQLSKLTYKSRAVRIMAPEIPEVIEEKKEKKQPSKTGSGLLAMLPRPKNEFLAQPKQLKPASVTTQKLIPQSVKKPIPKPKLASSTKKSTEHISDSDSENDEEADFFSLSAPDVPETSVLEEKGIDLPSTNPVVSLNDIPIPLNSPQDVPLPTTESSTFYIDTNREPVQQSSSNSYDYMTIQQPDDQLELDSEALAALCGSRGLKRKAGKDEFRIIDINGSQLTPDSQELLSKNLTVDQPAQRRNTKDGPTSQQKRKHQIIYLAHQAKEQELELQNTWANNRMSKKQTQAKYGF